MARDLDDVAVVIGRFQPVHNGHVALIRCAQALAKRTIIVVGSAQGQTAEDRRNPFTYHERIGLIQDVVIDAGLNPTFFAGVVDCYGDDPKWVASVKAVVLNTVREYRLVCEHVEPKVVLVGHNKDDSSFYLNMFPEWRFWDYGSAGPVCATKIREVWYNCIDTNKDFAAELYDNHRDMFNQLPKQSIGFLSSMAKKF